MSNSRVAALMSLALMISSACGANTLPSAATQAQSTIPIPTGIGSVVLATPQHVSRTPFATAAPAATPAPPSSSPATVGQDGVTTSDLTIDPDMPTPVYLVAPASAGAHSAAGIVWFHWLETGDPTSNRTEFLSEAQAMAQDGVVSVLVEGSFPWRDSPSSIDHDVAALQSEVSMLSDARDLLKAQPAVDPARIALVGHDFGAMYSSVLFGQDQSLAALVMMAPTARWSDWFLKYWQISDDAAAYKAAMKPFDPVSALKDTDGRPVLLQFATEDLYVSTATAAQITAAAGKPAERLDYDTDHSLKVRDVQADRDEWLTRILDLGQAPEAS